MLLDTLLSHTRGIRECLFLALPLLHVLRSPTLMCFIWDRTKMRVSYRLPPFIGEMKTVSVLSSFPGLSPLFSVRWCTAVNRSPLSSVYTVQQVPGGPFCVFRFLRMPNPNVSAATIEAMSALWREPSISPAEEEVSDSGPGSPDEKEAEDARCVDTNSNKNTNTCLCFLFCSTTLDLWSLYHSGGFFGFVATANLRPPQAANPVTWPPPLHRPTGADAPSCDNSVWCS